MRCRISIAEEKYFGTKLLLLADAGESREAIYSRFYPKWCVSTLLAMRTAHSKAHKCTPAYDVLEIVQQYRFISSENNACMRRNFEIKPRATPIVLSTGERKGTARASGRGKSSIKTRKIMKSLCSGSAFSPAMPTLPSMHFNGNFASHLLHYFHCNIQSCPCSLFPIIRFRCRSSLFPLIRPHRLLSERAFAFHFHILLRRPHPRPQDPERRGALHRKELNCPHIQVKAYLISIKWMERFQFNRNACIFPFISKLISPHFEFSFVN